MAEPRTQGLFDLVARYRQLVVALGTQAGPELEASVLEVEREILRLFRERASRKLRPKDVLELRALIREIVENATPGAAAAVGSFLGDGVRVARAKTAASTRYLLDLVRVPAAREVLATIATFEGKSEERVFLTADFYAERFRLSWNDAWTRNLEAIGQLAEEEALKGSDWASLARSIEPYLEGMTETGQRTTPAGTVLDLKDRPIRGYVHRTAFARGVARTMLREINARETVDAGLAVGFRYFVNIGVPDDRQSLICAAACMAGAMLLEEWAQWNRDRDNPSEDGGPPLRHVLNCRDELNGIPAAAKDWDWTQPNPAADTYRKKYAGGFENKYGHTAKAKAKPKRPRPAPASTPTPAPAPISAPPAGLPRNAAEYLARVGSGPGEAERKAAIEAREKADSARGDGYINARVAVATIADPSERESGHQLLFRLSQGREDPATIAIPPGFPAVAELEEYRRLELAARAAKAAIAQLEQAIAATVEPLLDQVARPLPGIDLKSARRADAETKAAIDKGVALLGRLVRNASWEPFPVEFSIRSVATRASAEPPDLQRGLPAVVTLGKGSEVRAVVHELGHTIEFADRAIERECKAFLQRRATSSTPERLSALTGKPYAASEVALPDKFRDPYVGKVYTRYTEVLSMGIEWLLTDPIAFAKEDPDMFDFILGLVRP